MMKWVYELMKDMSWKISIDWSFHVGIARLMEALNLIHDELKLEKYSKSIPKAFEIFVTHLFPYAPHVS